MHKPSKSRHLIFRVRRVVTLALLTAILPVHGWAEEPFPSKPIRIVVPFPAGGGSDIVARIVGARMATRMGQPVLVENVAGASSMIGAGKVASAPADGYTLLMATNTTLSTNPFVQAKLPYDAATSFVAVSQVIRTPLVLIANPQFEARDVPALISMAKKEPGKLSYASFGNATTGHIGGELFKRDTGTSLIHIPYKGSAPAIQDLVSGQVPILFDTASTALAQVKAGRARGLAVMQPDRSALAPDIPSMKEFGYSGIDITVWFGLVAPAGTPDAIVQRLSREVQEIVREPDTRLKLVGVNVEPVGSTPAAFADFLRTDRAAMARVIREAGIRSDQ
ncbi:Bug family tripartite tricarboxylate transporter substrate binding protein [Polaromonas glacialis]|uniref:Bug family tripartite tricarboxylate transporter substrate binding protein n=1 Tax=Polaromonas glacialis TaxID=866564 RepID=UPI0012EB2598|nr:tripartite tricarboxylate transporter substrate binding protein [Polaromonas glacialis]